MPRQNNDDVETRPNAVRIPCSKKPTGATSGRLVFGINGKDISDDTVFNSLEFLCRRVPYSELDSCEVVMKCDRGIEKSLIGYRIQRSTGKSGGAADPTFGWISHLCQLI